MQHCDPDELASAAFEEQLSAEDAAHLADCAECQREVASLRRSVDVLAVPALAAPDQAIAPPPQVWAAIAAATGVSVTPRPATDETTAPDLTAAPDLATAPGLAAVPAETDPEPVAPQPAGTEPGSATVVPIGSRRRPAARWLPLAAAVLAGGVIGAGAVAVTQSGEDAVVLARTGLDPLPDQTGSGNAEVRENGPLRELRVDLDVPDLDDGYYEVWLLQPDAQQMVPVGIVRRGATVLPLPAGLDLDAYPLVDVSVEPLDGDPTHSGVSVARGQLST